MAYNDQRVGMDIGAKLVEAARAVVGGPYGRAAAALRDIEDVADIAGRPAVGHDLGELFLRVADRLWESGWRPAEVVRVMRRSRSAACAELGLTALAASSACASPPPTGAPRAWREEVARLGIRRWWGEGSDWLNPSVAKRRSDWSGELRLALEALGAVVDLPPIELLEPPPSAWGELGVDLDGIVDDAVLARIRALLAKAESTSFEAEAEALSAKAQELMTRHAIDAAVAQTAGGEVRDRPVARRLAVDDPYASAKSFLLSAVAAANGARCVWYKDLALMAVIGFAADLDAIELLFTSLLVQGNRAMLGQGSVSDCYGRSQTRSYRQSFLLAFASRIRERLVAAAASARSQAEQDLGRSLVPVLARRADDVDDAVAGLFPRLGRRRGPSATNEAGWRAGRVAGELANLHAATGTLARTPP